MRPLPLALRLAHLKVISCVSLDLSKLFELANVFLVPGTVFDQSRLSSSNINADV